MTLVFGRVLPMLAQAAPEPFDAPGWVFEVKWDGYRAIAFLDHKSTGRAGGTGGTLLQSRRLRDLTPRYPSLTRLERYLEAQSAVLDGEIVALREGRPDFGSLQTGQGALVYVVFDLLELDRRVLLDRPLAERRRLLRGRLGRGPELVHSEGVETSGTAFHRAAVAGGLEGTVAKRLDSPYRLGRRTGEWLKVRNVHRAFCLVLGYTPAADARPIGALVLGALDAGGRLVFVGHTGTGFGDREAAALVQRLGPPVPCPLAGGEPPGLGGRVVWVRPTRVVEVEYLERTREGRLRHPVFRGLRPDKDADDCRLRAEPDGAAADRPGP